MAVIAVLAAVLLLIGPSIGKRSYSKVLGRFKAWKGPSLDMAPDSVDDMYRGCETQMETKIKTEFLGKEKSYSKNFREAWGIAETYYNTKWRGKSSLRKEEIMAIHAYTLASPKLYLEFNNAVRTQKHKYTPTFAYHTLHFYLTSAIKTLNAEKPLAHRCFTSYRRVNSEFRMNLLSNRIRFGAFTSSSLGSYGPIHFGEKTCFEIYTCFGASISKYSKFESEREALIPPYEVFEVKRKEKRSAKKTLPCEVVYYVRSTGKPDSNLNCAFSKKKKF